MIKSKHHRPGLDVVTEMIYGEGAIHLDDCRMVIKRGVEISAHDEDGEHKFDRHRLGLYGVALLTEDVTNDDPKLQMWDCEIIIIPRKKYRNGFNGKRADQILTSGSLGNPEAWEEVIFERKD